MAEESALKSGATADYSVALLKYLGDREPLEVFATTGGELRAAVKGLTKRQLQMPEAPGKWGVAAVVKHLADVEVVLGFRYRKVLGEPGTRIPAIDQDAWAERFEYMTADVPAALDDFDAVRATNLRLLKSVKEGEWELFGIHEQRGNETLRHMVRLYAAHDCYHLYQIDRIKKAIGV